MLHTEFEDAYSQLRSMAASRVRRDGTLSPTALINELFIKLAGAQQVEIRSRGEFLSMAAKAMRQIAIDYARAGNAEKRGGGKEAVTLTDVAGKPLSLDLLDLDQALSDLEMVQPDSESLVELKFFAGLTLPEIAELKDVSLRSVSRRWATARAFLSARMTLKPSE